MSHPEEVLLRVYGNASLKDIAARWGIDDDEPAERLGQLWSDKRDRKKIVEQLPDDQRGFLAFMDKIGRRLRGERLKKRWFLHGYDDFEQRITPLIEQGIVLVGNKDAREAVSLETANEQGITQQWLQVTPGFDGFAGKPPEARKVVETVDDETRPERVRRLCVVEFNLLNAVRFVEIERVRLNRDASPHRSDLKNMALWLLDPENAAETGSISPDPLNVYGWNIHILSLSLGQALGMVLCEDDHLIVDSHAVVSYFKKPIEERVPLLFRALEQQRAWNELEVVTWFASGEPPQTGQGHGAFLPDEERGSALAGPRGSVISALRRLGPSDWFDVDETVKTITSLEQQYLTSSLPVGVSGEPVIEDFVRAMVTRSLYQIGGIELGRSSKGEARARLTDIGRFVIGDESPVQEVDGQGAIVVEPSFEITCFLDMAPASLLYDLSRFAELIDTSERVIRYRLSGESVQWGYARGYNAEMIQDILKRYTHQDLPNAVIFALEDWERIHRRVTIYVRGDLVAATGRSEPEVVQSGVLFAVPDQEQTEIVSDTFTFVSEGHPEELDRALRAHRPQVFDYSGPLIPSLEWIDDVSLRAPRGATDLRTLCRLRKLTVQQDDDVYTVEVERMRKSVGLTEGTQLLFSVLSDGVVGGLEASREFSLKKLLENPAESKIGTMEILVLDTDEDGERVARIDELSAFIERRLGARAFHIKEGKAEALEQKLHELGVNVSTRS